MITYRMIDVRAPCREPSLPSAVRRYLVPAGGDSQNQTLSKLYAPGLRHNFLHERLRIPKRYDHLFVDPPPCPGHVLHAKLFARLEENLLNGRVVRKINPWEHCKR